MRSIIHLAQRLGPLARRALAPKAWNNAYTGDQFRTLDAFCPPVKLPARSGEFEVLFTLTSNDPTWRQAMAVPLVWETHTEQDYCAPDVPPAIKQLESAVLQWAGERMQNWHLLPRGGWTTAHFQCLCPDGEKTAESGFVPAAAALELALSYPGLVAVPTVFSTGLGVLGQDRLEPADAEDTKREAARTLIQEQGYDEKAFRFFVVASGPAAAGMEPLSPRNLIKTALVPLTRAMAAEPGEDAADQAFDEYYRLLGSGAQQDDFYMTRLLPALYRRRRAKGEMLSGNKILVTVGSGSPQPPATVAVLIEATKVILLYTRAQEAQANECKSLVQRALASTFDHGGSCEVVLLPLGEHTFDSVYAGLQNCLATYGPHVVLDLLSGSKFFTVAMDRLAQKNMKLVWLERGHSPTCPEPMKSRLTTLAPRG